MDLCVEKIGKLYRPVPCPPSALKSGKATFDRRKSMCKGPEVEMRLVCCNNRKKVQFGWSRVSEGLVEGQDEDRDGTGADDAGPCQS